MRRGRAIFVEGDLDAGDTRRPPDLVNQRFRRMAVLPAVRSEQDDTIAFAAIVVAKVPRPVFVETDDGFDPAGPIEIGPLVGKAQMRLDDLFADGFEIKHAGIAGQIVAHPLPAIELMPGSGSAWTVQ